MRKSFLAIAALGAALTGCKSLDGSFGFDSPAIAGGGAVAGKDYVTGLKPSADARSFFAKARSSGAEKVKVTRGDDAGTGVVWTDDGGIVIPPGVSISFKNKGYCMDPHLPAPKAGEEMQFVRTSSLLPPRQLGAYKILMERAANGDQEVADNMQRIVWALRTSGSKDVMASYLTDRQKELIEEAANESGCYGGESPFDALLDEVVAELKQKAREEASKYTTVNVGGVSYNAFDLLEPEKGKQKVASHLQSLVNMSLNMPVSKAGFNYGALKDGIYTDIKGDGVLSFQATIANSTSEPFVFYPLDYAAQVGSGGSSSGFFATSQSGMKQRTTINTPEEGEANQPCRHNWRTVKYADRNRLRNERERDIDDMRSRLIDNLLAADKMPGYEYGAIIYELDGEIRSTPIVRGNMDYEMATFSGGLVRTTERNGKYYEYNADGSVNWSKAYDNYYCSYWSFIDRTGDYLTQKAGSFPAGDEIKKLPKGATPLEIFHMHPDDEHWYGNQRNHIFSEQDKTVANQLSVNISVMDTAGTFDLHKPRMIKEVCSKCGAVR